MSEAEDRDDTDFKATRKLRAVKNPPVTNTFEQECHHRIEKDARTERVHVFSRTHNTAIVILITV